MSYIEFEVTHEGEIFTVCGDVDWKGFVEPIVAPDPDCPQCAGRGSIRVGHEPPDEFNDEGEDIYDGCDCGKEVPGSGSTGHPTLEVQEVQGPDGEPLSVRDEAIFVVGVGGDTLAQRASEALDACQG